MEKIRKANGISMKKEINEFGTISYYNNKNEYHREDGPAIEYADGEKRWCKNGVFHREDGPAIEYPSGYKAWYKNGVRHREDGPAIEWVDGGRRYCYNGVEYLKIKTDEDWVRFIKLMIFQ